MLIRNRSNRQTGNPELTQQTILSNNSKCLEVVIRHDKRAKIAYENRKLSLN